MGNRGPQPGTGGRPRKPLADKMTEGRSKYTSVGIPLPEPVELEGAEMPPPHEFLSDEQKNGQELVANEIYKSTWEWLRKFRCEQMVTQQSLEQYACSHETIRNKNHHGNAAQRAGSVGDCGCAPALAQHGQVIYPQAPGLARNAPLRPMRKHILSADRSARKTVLLG